MEYYYLDDNNQVRGPLSPETMLALHSSGIIKDETMTVEAGTEDWVPFARRFAPAAGAPSLLPTVPPRAQASTAPARQNDKKSGLGLWINLIIMLVVSIGAWFGYQFVRAAIHPKSKSHALAEWYDFGFQQGCESRKAYHDFRKDSTPDRSHITHLLKNMGVDVRSVDAQAANLLYKGYKDALESKACAYVLPAEQNTSILPAPLRGYHHFETSKIVKNDTASANILERALAGTVLVEVLSREAEGHGSGFFIAPGIVMTNRHVVEKATNIRVQTADKSLVPAELIAADGALDVALLRIKQNDLPILNLGNSDNVHVGDEITAIGFPIVESLTATSTFGRISSTDRVIGENPCFHIDLTINHGNSGGPLLDRAGKVIGITTFGFGDFHADRFNFAIKINSLIPFIKKHCPEPLKLEN